MSLQTGHTREEVSPAIRRHPLSYGMQIASPRRGGSGWTAVRLSCESACKKGVTYRHPVQSINNTRLGSGPPLSPFGHKTRAQTADTRHITHGGTTHTGSHHTRRASSILGLLCYSVYPMFSSCEMGVFRRTRLLSPLWAACRVLRNVLVARLSKLTRVRRALRGGQKDPARMRQERGFVSAVHLLPSPEISPNLL